MTNENDLGNVIPFKKISDQKFPIYNEIKPKKYISVEDFETKIKFSSFGEEFINTGLDLALKFRQSFIQKLHLQNLTAMVIMLMIKNKISNIDISAEEIASMALTTKNVGFEFRKDGSCYIELTDIQPEIIGPSIIQ